MKVAPYLFFEGRCEEAVAFYQSALGAEVTAMLRYRDAPPNDGPSRLPPGSQDKIMHAHFTVGGAPIMASDGSCGGTPQFSGVSISLTAPDVASAEQAFAALAQGGDVRQPMIETFFSPRFGMVADKFGVAWIVVAEQPGQG